MWLSSLLGELRPTLRSHVMPPTLTGDQILEQWQRVVSEHGLIPREHGGLGHKLAMITRQKRAAGHLSRKVEREIDRLKASQPQTIAEGGPAALEQPAATSADPRLNQVSVEEPASASGTVSDGFKPSPHSSEVEVEGSTRAMPGDMEWF